MMSASQCYSKQDFETFEKRFQTTFFNSLSGFKSLNLVGSCDAQGSTNLTLVNSVFHVGANPPLIGLVFRPNSVPRHGLENILETESFTLNHVSKAMLERAHQSSARYDRNVSEFDACEFNREYGAIKAPYVQESQVKIGLKLAEVLPVELNATTIIISEIQEVILPNSAVGDDGYVDLEKLGSLTCAGLDAYFQPQFLKRLSYPKVDRPVQALGGQDRK